jgi:type II secretory pathway pseudopilin PulG
VTHGVTITKGARRAAIGLLVLTLITGIGNLWASYAEVQASQAAQQREQAAQQRQAAAQAAAQLKQSKAICVALVGLDDASQGAVFAPQSRTGVPLPESYGYRLAEHIHAVVQATDCRALLAGKAAGS